MELGRKLRNPQRNLKGIRRGKKKEHTHTGKEGNKNSCRQQQQKKEDNGSLLYSLLMGVCACGCPKEKKKAFMGSEWEDGRRVKKKRDESWKGDSSRCLSLGWLPIATFIDGFNTVFHLGLGYLGLRFDHSFVFLYFFPFYFSSRKKDCALFGRSSTLSSLETEK